MSRRRLIDRLLWSPLKGAAEAVWYSRSRIPFLNFAIPCRLPYGGRFLAYGDAMGARICGYRLAGHPYEQEQWKFIARFLKPGMTCFDIGANQGFYTILASSLAVTGKVFAFEPAPTEFRKLIRNLSTNGCRNVICEAKALGSSEGVTGFHLCLDHQGSFSSIREPAADVISRTKVIKVPMTTLDSYVRQHNISSLDLLKMDVEGGELEVLKGAREVLQEYRPIILCEIDDQRTQPWGYVAREIIDYLAQDGYHWFAATPTGGLTRHQAKGQYSGANLVAVKSLETIQGLLEGRC